MNTYIFLEITEMVDYGKEGNTMPKQIMDLIENGKISGKFIAYSRLSILEKPVCPKSLFFEFSDKFGYEVGKYFKDRDFLILEYNINNSKETFIELNEVLWFNVNSYLVCTLTGYSHNCVLYCNEKGRNSTLTDGFILTDADEVNGILYEDYLDMISPSVPSKEMTIEDALFIVNQKSRNILGQVVRDSGYEVHDYPYFTLNQVVKNANLAQILTVYERRQAMQRDLF